jgi:hypothetical protein
VPAADVQRELLRQGADLGGIDAAHPAADRGTSAPAPAVERPASLAGSLHTAVTARDGTRG